MALNGTNLICEDDAVELRVGDVVYTVAVPGDFTLAAGGFLTKTTDPGTCSGMPLTITIATGGTFVDCS